MRFQLPFESDAQLAEAYEPVMRAIYDSSGFSQTLTTLDAFSCDAVGDPSPLQMVTAILVVVSFVRMQFGRSAEWLASESFDSWQCVQALLEQHGVMLVCSTDQHNKGNAASSYNDVTIGAELASIRGVGLVFWPPGDLELTSHQCWPGPNQSGLIYEDAPALPDAGAARLPPLAALGDVSSTSCRYRAPAVGEGPPKECLPPENKESLGI